jgi:hypothetical protein
MNIHHVEDVVVAFFLTKFSFKLIVVFRACNSRMHFIDCVRGFSPFHLRGKIQFLKKKF